MKKIYGLIRSGDQYFYAMQDEAFVIKWGPRPMAWRKTPSTNWQRTHGNFLKLDMLGIGILELDPIAEFDRSSSMVYRLATSTGRFEYEPDWNDAVAFPNWQEDANWKEVVSEFMNEIEPKVLEKLREFSHFHFQQLEALDACPGFVGLLDINPAFAACLAGRIRVGASEGERRARLDYKSLYLRNEKKIAAALGLEDSDEVVKITRKLVPDACKPLALVELPKFLENTVTREALLATEVISYPALLLLRNPYLSRHLTGGFLSEFSRLFPHSLDILTCPWGPLLRGAGKGEDFTWKYQQALDVVQFAEDPTIYSIEDLERKHSAIFMTAYNSRYHVRGVK